MELLSVKNANNSKIKSNEKTLLLTHTAVKRCPKLPHSSCETVNVMVVNQ